MDDLFVTLRALRAEGKAEEALARLKAELRKSSPTPEMLDRAGRWIAKDLAERPVGDAIGVRVLGQCTTTWLLPMMTALGLARGVRLDVTEGEYDSVMQEAASLAAHAPQVVVLLPWHQRVLGTSERAPAARIADEVEFWKQVWALVRSNSTARIVMVGYDWIVPGALGANLGGGAGGDVALLRELDAQLRQQLPANAFFVDLQLITGELGRRAAYEPRQYNWTKQPFTSAGLAALAHHLVAGIRASIAGSKKVLVLDLDNTLWGGVVGETGALGIGLGNNADGEAFSAFQRHVKALSKRGVLLAVASKNNPDDAREPFEKNPESVLAMTDFAAFEASWNPKEQSLRAIAQTLGLGLDSFVFFDDNPAEREHIRQAIPEVEVVEVPEEPAEYVRALQAGGWFEAVALTDEDRARTEQYVVERQRAELKGTADSLDTYLTSLAMVADVRPVDDADLPRVVQLLGKTNQWNLTTRRHSEARVRQFLTAPRTVALTLRLEDRFGDYGLVGVLLAIEQERAERPTLVIDTWLLSCRVIGRTVEQLLIGEVISHASALAYERVEAEYIPTKKNVLVARVYDDLAFVRIHESEAGTVRYRLALPAERPRTFITAVSSAPE